jgi:hypothetical protein
LIINRAAKWVEEKTWKMTWAGYVAYIRGTRNAHRDFFGRDKRRSRLRDLGPEGRII